VARCIRAGERHAWLEIVLDEGRNRQIRRLLAAFDVSVLRLVRVAIGPLALADLPKGGWRMLTEPEIASLTARAAI
jgi:23S rRNA pseudouridine2605 synthase